MKVRAIVRDDEILSGRWRIDGTMIPVAEIRRHVDAYPALSPEAHVFPTVSIEEVDAALAFAFPAIREPNVQSMYGTIVISCVCGEEIFMTMTALPQTRINCACGRQWNAEVVVEPAK